MNIRPLSLLVCSALMTSGALGAPAMWEVSDGDSSIFLFGSVHMLSPAEEWRTPLLDKVIDKADRIYFETDLSPAGQAEAAALAISLGFNTDGKLLSDMIEPELMERVRAAAAEYNVPVVGLLAMQPWMAGVSLASGPLMKSGYDARYGVETVLSAEIDPERVGMLETVAEQMALLSGGTEAEGIEMLTATLDSMHSVEADIKALTQAWVDGDPEGLGQAFTEQMGPYDGAIVERLIDNRNKNWTVQIADMLARDEKAFLVVGAAHLAGEMSVVKLLEEQGFTSKRMQ